ncbi:zinc uptake protein ZrgA [Photobacterium minamisatsumaniensis]|uniref:zinc uptake protein ZrgA n=1 Tax=Photobacterium minamisatsumaniensis TaxID=2910233 RepID=UPI003D09A3EF
MNTIKALSLSSIAITSVLFTSATQAEEHFRQHNAHVHGVVELNVAQDGNQILLEVTAPGSDVVGFEHSPQNDQQQTLLKKAISTLSDTNSLFIFPKEAKCQVSEKSITETLTGHDGHGHDEHGHDEHGHDEHGHDKHGHDKHGHGEFSAQYVYTCNNTEKLEHIDVRWFEYFSSTESITINAITETTQQTGKLLPSSTVFKF